MQIAIFHNICSNFWNILGKYDGCARFDTIKHIRNVHLKIKVPTYLTEEQKDLIKDFAYLEKDTPGTINGIDRSRPNPTFRHRQAEPQSQTQQSESFDQNNQSVPEQEPKKEGFFATLKKKLIG